MILTPEPLSHQNDFRGSGTGSIKSYESLILHLTP